MNEERVSQFLDILVKVFSKENYIDSISFLAK